MGLALPAGTMLSSLKSASFSWTSWLWKVTLCNGSQARGCECAVLMLFSKSAPW